MTVNHEDWPEDLSSKTFNIIWEKTNSWQQNFDFFKSKNWHLRMKIFNKKPKRVLFTYLIECLRLSLLLILSTWWTCLHWVLWFGQWAIKTNCLEVFIIRDPWFCKKRSTWLFQRNIAVFMLVIGRFQTYFSPIDDPFLVSTSFSYPCWWPK